MGQVENQIDRGREAMKYFHNASMKYPGYNYEFNEMVNVVSKGHPSIFLEGLGFAIESIGDEYLPVSSIQNSMVNLATQGMGRLPSSQQAFFKALSNQAQNVSWLDVSKNVVSDVVEGVGDGLASGGETVIGVLKSLNVLLPILIVGGVLYVAVSKIRKAA